MTRRGERNIPDFSRKPKPSSGVAPDRNATAPTPKPKAPKSKPQPTSSKGGRRGT